MKTLYIVATPIGNLQDITIRAAKTLLESKIIIAESTSKAGILLDFLKKQFPDITYEEKQIISLTEDQEEQKIPYVINLLEQSDGALISEAGTPLISDPGFKLVREAIKKEVNIIPIPGASAVISALSASGLPTDKFFFVGFLPKSSSKKDTTLVNLKNLGFKTTIVAYESPERIVETIQQILNSVGNVEIVVGREITKIHEEFLRGKAADVIEKLKEKNIKGEITLVFSNST